MLAHDDFTRVELAAWHELISWLDDPEREPDRYVWLGELVGWARADRVEVRSRAPSKLAPQASRAPRFLTLQEASALIRTPAETIRYWIWQGRLQAYKPGRAVLVRESELLALTEARVTRALRAEQTRKPRAVVGR